MCVMLIQCFGCPNLGHHRGARTERAALTTHIHVPLDAQLALVVDCVATALDELASARGAAQIAQFPVPLDTQLALVVECVATALDFASSTCAGAGDCVAAAQI